MFGRGKQDEYARQLAEANAADRAHQLRKDPSSVKGLTQKELNELIDTGTISAETLRSIL